jgi:hypothetical protein
MSYTLWRRAGSFVPCPRARTGDGCAPGCGPAAKRSTTSPRSNPQSSLKDWYSQATIARVVRKGVNGGYEMPYKSQGFRVIPSV